MTAIRSSNRLAADLPAAPKASALQLKYADGIAAGQQPVNRFVIHGIRSISTTVPLVFWTISIQRWITVRVRRPQYIHFQQADLLHRFLGKLGDCMSVCVSLQGQKVHQFLLPITTPAACTEACGAFLPGPGRIDQALDLIIVFISVDKIG
jgi:hypothetical protein